MCKILLKAGEYGFRVFIDPHQDVWSRFSGGSGAPGWTLEKVGLEMKNFTNGNAAMVHNTYPDPMDFPKMIWATNYYKLAAATMFTLFFAGDVFAPKLFIDGQSAQRFLQSHFLNAMSRVAQAIVATPGLADRVVVGYDTLNEPHYGWVGWEDISILSPHQELRNGLTPTPLQAMVLGNGTACDNVQVWELSSLGPQKVSSTTVDPKGVRAWQEGVECIWARHGVWDPDTGKCLLPLYFQTSPKTGNPVNFLVDFWKPFINVFTTTLRKVHQGCIIFVEPPVNALPPDFGEDDATDNLCYAPHFYDGLTLLNKTFNQWFTVDYIGYLRGQYSSIAFALRFGIAGIKSAFTSQLNTLRVEGQENIGEYPCIFGEIGIPFDLDGKHAYISGDYSAQIKALDANMTALERNLLNFTLWTYCPDNSNTWGDQWNGEDLSLWSPPLKAQVHSSQTEFTPEDLNAGARAMEAYVRPCPIHVPGIPQWIEFDLATCTFKFTFRDFPTPCKNSDLEIFLPSLHFKTGHVRIEVSDGTVEWSEKAQRLYWRADLASPGPSSGKEFNAEPKEHTIAVYGSLGSYEEDYRATQANDGTGDVLCPQCSVM